MPTSRSLNGRWKCVKEMDYGFVMNQFDIPTSDCNTFYEKLKPSAEITVLDEGSDEIQGVHFEQVVDQVLIRLDSGEECWVSEGVLDYFRRIRKKH